MHDESIDLIYDHLEGVDVDVSPLKSHLYHILGEGVLVEPSLLYFKNGRRHTRTHTHQTRRLEREKRAHIYITQIQGERKNNKEMI